MKKKREWKEACSVTYNIRRLDLIHARYSSLHISMRRAWVAVEIKVTVKHMPKAMCLRQARSAREDRLGEKAEESRLYNQGSLKSPHLTFSCT